jgi:hypothetical protein
LDRERLRRALRLNTQRFLLGKLQFLNLKFQKMPRPRRYAARGKEVKPPGRYGVLAPTPNTTRTPL